MSKRSRSGSPSARAPSLMNAAVVVRNNNEFSFEIEKRQVPKIQPWEVLVKVSAVGLCGTDVHLAAGHVPSSCEILGHEGVGRVVSIGSGVDPSIVNMNSRIGIGWVRDACGQCQYCRIPGGETRCEQQLNSGRKIDGCFAEYCVVPARYLLVLPDKMPDDQVAPILCGGVTAYNAVKSSKAVPGDWIAIMGAAGGVGGFAVQYAKAMGYRVLAIDVGSERGDFCRQLGTDVYCDVKESRRIVEPGYPLTDGQLPKAVIVTAGVGAAYSTAFDIVAAFGTVVCVGIPPPNEGINLHPLAFIDRGISIVGILVGTRQETLEALEFVQRGLVRPIVHKITLQDLNDSARVLSTATGKFVIEMDP